MKTYETRSQYLADCTDKRPNSHRPPATPYLWTCDTCGKVSPHSDGHGVCGHSMHCYDCCTARDVAELLDRSKPFVGYLSSDCRQFTTWTGGLLGRVVRVSESRTGWYGFRLTHVRVIDVHGNPWHGKGSGAGMCIRLHPSKA